MHDAAEQRAQRAHDAASVDERRGEVGAVCEDGGDGVAHVGAGDAFFVFIFEGGLFPVRMWMRREEEEKEGKLREWEREERIFFLSPFVFFPPCLSPFSLHLFPSP